MGTIAKVTAGGATHLVASTCYGTCDTAKNTAAKVATIQDSQAFTLITGVTVHIKFTYSNTAYNPTLNVNNTGAKAIMSYGTTAPLINSTYSWYAGSVVSLTYDGTYWQMNNFKYDTNTNDSVTQTNTTENANYRVLFSATDDDATRTEGARKSAYLTFNPTHRQLFLESVDVGDVGWFSAMTTGNDDLKGSVILGYEGSDGNYLQRCMLDGSPDGGALYLWNTSDTTKDIRLESSTGTVTATTFDGNATHLTDAGNTAALRYINSNDTTTWTADALGATDSISVIRGNVTGAWTTGHVAVFNCATVGTPFQLGIHDSSDLYLYKRYYTEGTWKAWSKMNAGNADTATTAGNVTGTVAIANGGTGATTKNAAGTNLGFNWSGQSGTPTYVWGGSSQGTYYVYQPKNFAVASATTATNLSGSKTGLRFYAGTTIANPGGGDSVALFTMTTLNSWFGVNNCGAGNTAVFISNGDGSAWDAHYEGATCVGTTWYAVFNKSKSGNCRINYLVVYWPS